MANESLKAPLASNQQQIRRELLPKEWSAALVLDYLDKSEYGGELTQRTLAIGQATYELQVTVEGLVIDVAAVTDGLADHVGTNTAHGALGDIVGSENFAESGRGGAVFQAISVADAVDSLVNITTPDASAAPLVYSQAQMQEVVTLLNEVKAAVNQLAGDLNSSNAVINDSLESERIARQRAL